MPFHFFTSVQSLRCHPLLVCFGISAALIGYATQLYPGGSLFDPHSVGFVWSKNFISNLFGATAVNGSPNPSRIWAILGVAFHSVGLGLFFIRMAPKMPDRHAAAVLNWVGVVTLLFDVLVATPMHDFMVTVSGTLSLLALFYITVFVLRSKLHLAKVACVGCLLLIYFTLYLYGAGHWSLLAVMQKVSFATSMLLVLGLEYFTHPGDFSKNAG